MTVSILVPPMGESIAEASVSKWLKPVGARVAADEPVAELETDKVTIEVPAPVAGVLSKIEAAEGSIVIVGSILGMIEPADLSAPEPVRSVVPPPLPEPRPALSTGSAPSARKLIAENRLDAGSIHGSGRDGRIIKEDVLSALSRSVAETPEPSPTSSPREQRVRMTRLRAKIAQRLKEAQNNAAILTTFNEVDMSAIAELRKTYRESFEKRHGVRLGFMSFFVKACVTALKEWPTVNSEIDGDEVIYKNHYDIGVAVGTAAGLVVPVVKDADLASFADLEKTIATFGEKARDGRLTIQEMTGGTFTISNGGVYGSLMSTPIINPPQSAILGMHKTMMRPVVTPDGSIEARPMMYLALSYDHRIIDGREAVSFLVRVKECIENPSRIMLEV